MPIKNIRIHFKDDKNIRLVKKGHMWMDLNSPEVMVSEKVVKRMMRKILTEIDRIATIFLDDRKVTKEYFLRIW